MATRLKPFSISNFHATITSPSEVKGYYDSTLIYAKSFPGLIDKMDRECQGKLPIENLGLKKRIHWMSKQVKNPISGESYGNQKVYYKWTDGVNEVCCRRILTIQTAAEFAKTVVEYTDANGQKCRHSFLATELDNYYRKHLAVETNQGSKWKIDFTVKNRDLVNSLKMLGVAVDFEEAGHGIWEDTSVFAVHS